MIISETNRRWLVTISSLLLILVGMVLMFALRKVEVASVFAACAALIVVLAAPRVPLSFRIVVALFALAALAAGGWLDLNFWDLERPNPSPHFLGPPR